MMNPVVSFQPPEVISEVADGSLESLSTNEWERALQYHHLKKSINDPIKKQKLRASAIRAIIKKAMATMGSVSKAEILKVLPWELLPHGEIDLETSLEEGTGLDSLMVETREPKRSDIVVCVDTSLSMTGKKLAITGVALAVFGLQIEPEDLSVVSFETDATVIKPLGSKTYLAEMLGKFLDVPARGLTNIEAGLSKALEQLQKGRNKKKTIILLSDGKFTAGRDPTKLASHAQHLHILQTGNQWSSPRFCRNLAQKGNGKFIRIAKIEDLPKAMYGLLREITR